MTTTSPTPRVGVIGGGGEVGGVKLVLLHEQSHVYGYCYTMRQS